jgi:stage II sporulation protein GA (sporulation sigma-E factor processing peptidase)
LDGVLYVEVYADVVLLLNFIIDLGWLCVTAYVVGVPIRLYRFGVIAALWAVATLWTYFPSGRWLMSYPWVFLGTLVALLGAYLPCRPWQVGLSVMAFMITGTIMEASGRLMGTQRMAWGLPVDHPSAVGTLVGILMAQAGVRVLWGWVMALGRVVQGLYRLQVTIGGATVTLPALLDTGNHLKEPLGGQPVVVVEEAALAPVLPPELAAVRCREDVQRLSPSWLHRFRLVPYRGVGQTAGELVAFRPDRLAVRHRLGRTWRAVGGWVAIVPGRLHETGAFRALLPPALVEPVGDFHAELSIPGEGESL